MARRERPGKSEAPAKKSAWERALDALSRRALTTGEVAGKLARAGYTGEEIDGVLDRLRRLSFVDDSQVAYNHARRRAEEGRRGPLRVRSELLARGIPSELADEAIADAFPADQARERVNRAAEKLAGSKGVPADRAGRTKLARRLARAGFPVEMVTDWLERGADDDGLP